MAAPNLAAGATATFATTAFSASLTRIGLPTSTREAVDVTVISSDTQMEYIPAAKFDPGVIEIEGWFDPAFSTMPPIDQSRELLTIDYDGSAGAPTMTATGFATSVDYGEIVAAGNAPIRFVMQFQCDGGHNSGTALTHTAS